MKNKAIETETNEPTKRPHTVEQWRKQLQTEHDELQKQIKHEFGRDNSEAIAQSNKIGFALNILRQIDQHSEI